MNAVTSDTIFSRIMRGEIPATIVHADEHVVGVVELEADAGHVGGEFAGVLDLERHGDVLVLALVADAVDLEERGPRDGVLALGDGGVEEVAADEAGVRSLVADGGAFRDA